MSRPMQAFYSDEFVLPLPAGHRFPMTKYRLLRDRLAADARQRFQLTVPVAARDSQLLLAHEPGYLSRVVDGGLTRAEVRRLGFPWTPELVERARRSCGGTIEACRSAVESGVAVNLGGGTHHAFYDQAQGYCVFNDAAVAARLMQREYGLSKILIVDCDVHQGNGTAAILRDDASILTFSIHGAKNFPARKETSDVDIELDDGAGDVEYLDALKTNLPDTFRRAAPELVIYLAGADPFAGDRLGRLGLSKAGLEARDRRVLSLCADAGVPVAVTMAGGYAHDVNDIVDIHFRSIELACELLREPFQEEWSIAKPSSARSSTEQ